MLRNLKVPSNAFVLECPKDTCQERMISKGEEDPEYIPSTLLSQLIKQYNQASTQMVACLKEKA